MKGKPWVAKYWREYRTCRKIGWSRSKSRREAGKLASIWWHYTKGTIGYEVVTKEDKCRFDVLGYCKVCGVHALTDLSNKFCRGKKEE